MNKIQVNISSTPSDPLFYDFLKDIPKKRRSKIIKAIVKAFLDGRLSGTNIREIELLMESGSEFEDEEIDKFESRENNAKIIISTSNDNEDKTQKEFSDIKSLDPKPRRRRIIVDDDMTEVEKQVSEKLTGMFGE